MKVFYSLLRNGLRCSITKNSHDSFCLFQLKGWKNWFLVGSWQISADSSTSDDNNNLVGNKEEGTMGRDKVDCVEIEFGQATSQTIHFVVAVVFFSCLLVLLLSSSEY